MFRALIHRGPPRSHPRSRPRSGAARLGLALAAAVLCVAGSARAQPPQGPFTNAGLRWIGSAASCQAPPKWTASRLFRSTQLPVGLQRLCLYRWNQLGTQPIQLDIDRLSSVSESTDLAEDVPVVYQSAGFSPAQVEFLTGLRTALSAQVGNASLLPTPPTTKTPASRIVVVDTAPDASNGKIRPGASRHGDTLAHLIEDLVCLNTGSTPRPCAAEVTTSLALEGGVGTLGDLAGAIDRALALWQIGRNSAPATTPVHLIFNLSLGWEDLPGVADCSTQPTTSALPARAVAGILQFAAEQNALIIAAAGNDLGGTPPRTGLVCPGRYQAVPRGGNPAQSLVVAVSGVDYQDRPLANARPLGITGIAGLGFDGVAWGPTDLPPPPLTGSSVSTAVVSAISALVWSQQALWTTVQVTRAVYDGGTAVGTANACPLSIPGCASHRSSMCGALRQAGVATSCTTPAPYPGSNPGLPTEIDAVNTEFDALPPTVGVAAPTAAPLARNMLTGLQIKPWVYPMPIAETCPVCEVAGRALVMPALTTPIDNAILVVRYTDGTEQELALAPAPGNGTSLQSGVPYWFDLTTGNTASIASAYLTASTPPPAFPSGPPSYSITEPVFVEP